MRNLDEVYPKSFRNFEPERYFGGLQQEEYGEEDESKTTGWIGGGMGGWMDDWLVGWMAGRYIGMINIRS